MAPCKPASPPPQYLSYAAEVTGSLCTRVADEPSQVGTVVGKEILDRFRERCRGCRGPLIPGEAPTPPPLHFEVPLLTLRDGPSPAAVHGRER